VRGLGGLSVSRSDTHSLFLLYACMRVCLYVCLYVCVSVCLCPVCGVTTEGSRRGLFSLPVAVSRRIERHMCERPCLMLRVLPLFIPFLRVSVCERETSLQCDRVGERMNSLGNVSGPFALPSLLKHSQPAVQQPPKHTYIRVLSMDATTARRATRRRRRVEHIGMCVCVCVCVCV